MILPRKVQLSAAFTALDHPNVDLERGIISDVVVIARGPIKWDRGYADDLTLETVRDCAVERFGDDGFPIIFNPTTLAHGPGGMAGSAKDLRINERGLIADVHVLTTFQPRDYLFELATKQPRTIGLSIEYVPEPQNIGGKDYMRCLYFDGAAVVYTPAATPGLYSSRIAKNNVDTSRTRGQSRSSLMVIKPPKQTLLIIKK